MSNIRREICANQSSKVVCISRKRKSPNGFALYFKMDRSKLKEKFPNYSPQEIMKEAGRSWKKLPQTLRNSFTMYAMNDSSLRHYGRPTPPPLSPLPPPYTPLTTVFDYKDCCHPDDKMFDELINPESYTP
ncbi:unnamed protein product [Rhizophagus irregularis]|uniref:HMG box domain-containing protein n=1 Tax=Rhizophagus irregularis TaxID=588596 RepID=A0A2N1N341_9GLOM|nr:hypothetical protein RhiirC2_782435 [Rhizophagus irregularis]CAB4376700.1 unnamed protein product [Rhizophagus irregularis]